MIKFQIERSLVPEIYGQRLKKTIKLLNISLHFQNPEFLKGYLILILLLTLRKYLLNVVNTVDPDSVIKAVINIRMRKEKE